ncbi:MAG: hypothetical protein AB7F91_07905 [Parvularculaceae bacterium]
MKRALVKRRQGIENIEPRCLGKGEVESSILSRSTIKKGLVILEKRATGQLTRRDSHGNLAANAAFRSRTDRPRGALVTRETD